MLPQVITNFIESEHVPVTRSEALAIFIVFKGDVFDTLSALRDYEANCTLVNKSQIEAKARELNALRALRARDAVVEVKPLKHKPSLREIEAELLA